MRSWFMVAAAVLMSGGAVSAQPMPERVRPRPPELIAGEAGQKGSPLSLGKADIHTVIAGYLAETTMTLTFRNDGDRVLEGELAFPLPENATVSGYALDINGVLIDGVPVERQKARITYEKETRRRVDPGLVEMAVGNNFHTRVYPIPAHGIRTIKVQYVSEISDAADGSSCLYRLPLNWGQVVKECNIRVEVVRSAGEPASEPNHVIKLGFSKWEDRFVAEQKLTDTKLDDELVVLLPDAARQPVLVENRVKPRTVDEILENRRAADGSDYYFVINDRPTIPQVADTGPLKATRIAVLWDASLSRAEVDKTRELKLLRKLLGNVDPGGAVDVIAFRNEVDAPVTFPMSGGVDAIIAHLEKLVYDGGTDLSKLAITREPRLAGETHSRIDPAGYSYYLLFTDGLTNLGPEMPSKLEAPVYPISNDVHSNHTLLKRIAASAGGIYFNLDRVTDEQVSAGLTTTPYSLVAVECNPAEVTDIYPRGMQPVLGRMAVTGRLLVPEAKVTLKYGFGGRVLKSKEITLKQEGAAQTGLVPRFWAQQKVAELSSDVEGNGEALAAVGKEFNLVTPNTSLLVLETVDQYLQYKIIPPKNSGDLYTQFMSHIEQQKTQLAQTREERLNIVLAMWNARLQWWNTEYKYAKDLKYRDLEASSPVAVGAGSAGGVSDAATTSPRAPHPASPEGRIDQLQLQTAARDVRAEATHVAMPTDRPAPQVSGPAATLNITSATGLASSAAALKDAGGEADKGPTASITIKEWNPAVPYLVAMREAGGEGAYAVYLKQRKNFAASPAFYLDCADFLLRNGQKQMGIRVLTNIAELKLENAQLLRIVAHKLNQIGDRNLAINLFEKIKTMRPEEPQSWRDLALAMADRADDAHTLVSSTQLSAAVLADYQKSLELLNKVITTHWDRFDEIEVIALMEANEIIARINRAPHDKQLAFPIDARLIKNLDCDVRITLTWDADLTDVDLWVTEPSGEKCFYGHNRTTIGAAMSRDFTQGYGPEEYILKKAMTGEYKIQANYYGSSQASLVGPCTVQATVITDFGRPTEKRQYLTLRLTQAKDVVDVGTIKLGGK